jgi:hypothetical protein
LEAVFVSSPVDGTEQSHVVPKVESSASSKSPRSTEIQDAANLEQDNGSGILTPIQKSLDDSSNQTSSSREMLPLTNVSAVPNKGLDIVDLIQFSQPAERKQQALPQILSPLQRLHVAEKALEQRQKLIEDFEPVSINDGSQKFRSSFAIQEGEPDSYGPGRQASGDAWRQRLQEANANRAMLTKALAALVFIVGIINAGPAIFHWYQSWSATTSVAVPRWTYLQFFVAALHGLYAVFIFQVSDWSSLRAVSVVMLVFAFGFGIVSTALLLEGGHGTISNFFSLSHLMVGKATLWSVSMLCLATLVAYVSGKEANDWKRAEQLLVEILSQSA